MGCGISKIDPEEVGDGGGGRRPPRGLIRLHKRYTDPSGSVGTFLLPKHADLEDLESVDQDFSRKLVYSEAMGGRVGKAASGCGGGDHRVSNAFNRGDNEHMKREGEIVREKGGADDDHHKYDDQKVVRDGGDGDGDDERDLVSGGYDSITCPGPGSPSFREYCVDSDSRDVVNENYEGRSSTGAKVENKSQEEEPQHKKTKVMRKTSRESRRSRGSAMKNLFSNVTANSR